MNAVYRFSEEVDMNCSCTRRQRLRKKAHHLLRHGRALVMCVPTGGAFSSAATTWCVPGRPTQ